MLPHFLSEEFLSAANPYLLDAEIGAAVLLGIGIIYESDKYCEAVKRRAFHFVMWGVVLETIFTILLFKSETWIADKQRGTIIVLERRIAPREIGKYNQDVIAGILKKLNKPTFDVCVSPNIEENFRTEMIEMLVSAGWTLHNFGGPQATPEALIVPQGFDPGIGVCGIIGVRILVDPILEKEFNEPVAVLRAALNRLGIEASAFVMDTAPPMRADTVHIQIGSRL